MRLDVHHYFHQPSCGVGYVRFTLGPVQEQALDGPSPGEPTVTQMTDTQQVEGTLQFVNKKGNPAEVQAGSERFVASDGTVVDPTFAVVAGAKGQYTVKVVSLAPGAARVSFFADADLGDGIQEIEIFEDFSITGGAAVGGVFVFGTPQEQLEA